MGKRPASPTTPREGKQWKQAEEESIVEIVIDAGILY
jgi:hypothetical protein